MEYLSFAKFPKIARASPKGQYPVIPPKNQRAHVFHTRPCPSSPSIHPSRARALFNTRFFEEKACDLQSKSSEGGMSEANVRGTGNLSRKNLDFF